jgi:hypothetical protein
MFQSTGNRFGQVTRDVVEHSRRFDRGDAARRRAFEGVVPLVRIECAEFTAEDRLVVRDERRPPEAVINDVELTPEVRVPDVAPLFSEEVFHADVEIEPRQEFDRRRGGRRRLRVRRPGAQGRKRQHQERAAPH